MSEVARERPVSFLSWAVALAFCAVASLFSFAMVRAAESGDQPPFLDSRDHAPPRPPVLPRARNAGLTLAGSGSNLPLTRALLEAFAAQGPTRIELLESIGTSGGVRAVRDGVIDVGLASRGLDDEEARGLQVIPYARVPVVIAAGATVALEGLTSTQIVALFRGEMVTDDRGEQLVLFQRERGDSGQKVFERLVPGFREANEDAYREARFEVLYNDREMVEALLAVPTSLGVTDLAAIRAQGPRLHALTIDDATPSLPSLSRGEYRFYKDLSFVMREPPDGELAHFIAFAASDEAQRIAETLGCMTLQ